MPQLITLCTPAHYTDAQCDDLKATVESRLGNCDVEVLVLPPGVTVQNVWAPPLLLSAPAAQEGEHHAR